MMSRDYRAGLSVADLKSSFETMVPLDWGTVGPIEVGQTMTDWPDKRESDIGWTYVSIGGDVYSEAVTVVVAIEDGAARIRVVELGRP